MRLLVIFNCYSCQCTVDCWYQVNEMEITRICFSANTCKQLAGFGRIAGFFGRILGQYTIGDSCQFIVNWWAIYCHSFGLVLSPISYQFGRFFSLGYHEETANCDKILPWKKHIKVSWRNRYKYSNKILSSTTCITTKFIFV